MTIDTTNLCSHLQKKLFEPEGVYYPIWQAMQNDEELTAVVRSRQYIGIIRQDSHFIINKKSIPLKRMLFFLPISKKG